MKKEDYCRKIIYSPTSAILGKVVSNTYFTRRATQHYFVKYQGFGVSVNVIEELLELGVKWVVFEYYGKEGVKYYRIPLVRFVKESDEWVDDTFAWKKPDRQFICSTKHMEVIKGPDKTRT